MTQSVSTVVTALVVLSACTYALRVLGTWASSRVAVSEASERLTSDATAVLICAVAAVATLTADHEFSGIARTAGVAVGALFALRRAAFVVVGGAAASTTAMLRLAGVS